MTPVRPPGFGRFLLAIIACLLLPGIGSHIARPESETPPPSLQATQNLARSVVSGGGRLAATTRFRIVGSLGQPGPIGKVSALHHQVHSGFWAASHQLLTPVPEAPLPLMGQNYPNPFNPLTRIPIHLAGESHIELSVYDACGRRVRVLCRDTLPAGPHTFLWDGKDARGRQAATGVYFLRLATDEGTSVKKMVLVK